MKTINEIREDITNTRAKLTSAVNDALTLSKKDGVTFNELEAANAKTSLLRAELDALTNALKDAEATGKPKANVDPADASAKGEKGMTIALKAKLKSPEYARAWGKMVRSGLRPERPCPSDDMRVLYDALTEMGGTPEGADGGFLVPEDVDNTIHELLRSFNSMRSLVTVETVSSNKGSRVRDNAPTKGLVALDAELNEIDGSDDQPSFVPVSYSLTKFALIMEMSRELLNDNVANLMAYVSRWYAKKQTITENKLITALLNQQVAQNITPADDEDAIRKIRSILNLALDPAISATAMIVTNQSGLDYLDSIYDGNGRPMLTENPATGAPMLLRTRPILAFSNVQLPNRVVTAVGATKGTYIPLYVGDGLQYGTLFERQGLEFVTTDIGAGAFEKDSVKARGITRLGASRFDADAMVRREIFIAD